MSNLIKEYLIGELGYTKKIANKYLDNFKHHKDIQIEFEYWIKNKDFSKDRIHLYGYDAKKLFKNTYLTALGAYNFMIYLREEPKLALEDLSKGLPKK